MLKTKNIIDFQNVFKSSNYVFQLINHIPFFKIEKWREVVSSTHLLVLPSSSFGTNVVEKVISNIDSVFEIIEPFLNSRVFELFLLHIIQHSFHSIKSVIQPLNQIDVNFFPMDEVKNLRRSQPCI